MIWHNFNQIKSIFNKLNPFVNLHFCKHFNPLECRYSLWNWRSYSIISTNNFLFKCKSLTEQIIEIPLTKSLVGTSTRPIWPLAPLFGNCPRVGTFYFSMASLTYNHTKMFWPPVCDKPQTAERFSANSKYFQR